MNHGPHIDRRERARGALIAFITWSCIACALSCGGSQPTSRVPDRDARGSGESAMRAPPAHAPSDHAQLGTLQPIAVGEQPEPTDEAIKAPAAPQLEPIRVGKSPAPAPYALRDRDLVMPGGLIIHNVPRGVAVRTVAELDGGAPVLEFVDARGHRLALLKETALTRVTLGSGEPLLEAGTAARDRSARDDWAKTRVSVVTDRFQSDTHLYTLERRSAGTEWITGGLELASHR